MERKMKRLQKKKKKKKNKKKKVLEWPTFLIFAADQNCLGTKINNNKEEPDMLLLYLFS